MRDPELAIAVARIATSAKIMSDVFAMSRHDDEASVALLEQRITALHKALAVTERELARVKVDQLGVI